MRRSALIFLLAQQFRNRLLFLFVFAINGILSNALCSTPKYLGIKVGIEMEIVSPIKYVPNDGEKGLRHKRLLEVKNEGKLIWYVEIDSSSRNLEIVTFPPLELPEKMEDFDLILESITFFLSKIDNFIKDSEKGSVKKIDQIFLNEINTSWGFPYVISFSSTFAEGVICIKKDFSRIISVKPQISYQIPLEVIYDFFTLYDEDDFFSKNLKRIIKGMNSEKTKEAGFYNLFTYYIHCLNDKGEILDKLLKKAVLTYFDIHIPKPKKGEARSEYDHIVKEYKDLERSVLESDNADNKNKWAKVQKDNGLRFTETGLKQFLPIMSRTAFSDMFKKVRGKESVITKIYENHRGTKTIFPNYPFMKNPLYNNGVVLEDIDYEYPFRYLSTSLLKEVHDYDVSKITVDDWVASIINPSEYSRFRHIGHTKSEPETKEGAKKWLEAEGASSKENLIKYVRMIFRDQKMKMRDLMSPPPFSRETESMGGLYAPQNPQYGDVVLEVRNSKTLHPDSIKTFIFDRVQKICYELRRKNQSLFLGGE